MWFDHIEHMEEGPEQNKEWENFWWTVDEDMFTYVMKTKIEELIEEKLNQEFPEEVEIREDPDYDSEEEVTSETEATDDDESETNNANVNNYLDSANMAMNLETAMKIAEEDDLWIGDSGASSHMMGSEEHVFNKKLITGSVRTANGAHMKMLCEGDINVDVITKKGDVTSGTLRIYLDISSMRKPSMGGRQHWVLLVDEATKYKKSFFLKKKNEQVEPIIDWIKALKARHKNQVKIIRCDNAGENKVLERESDKNELGIIFEYTAPGTPQQNGVVERAFETVRGRARAMMNHAGFTMAKRQQLWCEAAQTATILDNILVQESAKSPPFTQFLE